MTGPYRSWHAAPVPVRVSSLGGPADLVSVGPRLLMPRVVLVQVTGMVDFPHLDVEVHVEAQDGHLIATTVCARQRPGGPAVTGERIRGIPVAHLVQWAASELRRVVETGGDTVSTVPAGVTEDEVAYVQHSGPTDRALEIVGRTYRMARLMGRPPTKMVEEWLNVPRSTVGRWVAAARTRGFLDKADGPGKAGG